MRNNATHRQPTHHQPTHRSIAVAKLYALKNGYDVSAASELKAVGAANVFGGALSTLPVMAAFGRSAVNDDAGARSQISGLVSAFTVLLLLLFATPAISYLPSPVLGSVIVVSVAKLIDIVGVAALWRLDKRDFLSFAAAFAATLALGVLWGVIAAMSFSLLLFVAFTTQPHIEELGRLEGTVVYRHLGLVGVQRVPQVKILKLLAPLFYANCAVLRDRMLAELARRAQLPPRLQWHALVLCFAAVATIDSTSLQMLNEVLIDVHAAHVPLLIASANANVESVLSNSGVVGRLGGQRMLFRRVHEAVRAVLLREVGPSDLPPSRRSDSAKEALPSSPNGVQRQWQWQRWISGDGALPPVAGTSAAAAVDASSVAVAEEASHPKTGPHPHTMSLGRHMTARLVPAERATNDNDDARR